MILSKFKERRVKKKIEKVLAKNTKDSALWPIDKISSILIFTDASFDKNQKVFFAKELGIDVSNISILNYQDKLQKGDISEETISTNDFGIFGEIKNNKIRDTIKTEFDLLLNLTKQNLFFDILTVVSKAKFKVGFTTSDKRLYDLMIDAEDMSVFSTELKKYLKILNIL